jgi:hypothetical protein
MSCYICDRQVDEPKLDPRDMKTAPCGTCEAAIQECLDGYPKVGEDPDDFYAYIEPEVEDFKEFLSYGPSTRDY